MMGDPLAGMIPYDAIGLYEQPKPIFRFKMPRVVPEQKTKFESDELFRRLSRESEVSANRAILRIANPVNGSTMHCSACWSLTKWKHVNKETKDLSVPSNWQQ